MNRAEISGRLTKDVDLRYSQDQKAFGRFTLAVRRRKKDDGADFINCTAFGKDAETISKYTRQGDPLNVAGRIRAGSYTNRDGVKVYTTEIYVDEFDLLASHKAEKQSEEPQDEGFVPAGDEDLPF